MLLGVDVEDASSVRTIFILNIILLYEKRRGTTKALGPQEQSFYVVARAIASQLDLVNALSRLPNPF